MEKIAPNHVELLKFAVMDAPTLTKILEGATLSFPLFVLDHFSWNKLWVSNFIKKIK